MTSCIRCNAGMPSFRTNTLCEECYAEESDDYDDECDEACPECGGTGIVPDNGTNMGECEDCCGTGLWTD